MFAGNHFLLVETEKNFDERTSKTVRFQKNYFENDVISILTVSATFMKLQTPSDVNRMCKPKKICSWGAHKSLQSLSLFY